jgi:sugar phosphate isomerase/epimerase
MKKENKSTVSRRHFLGTSATLIAGTAFGGNSRWVPSIIKNFNKPNSLINGVQIGVITYSFRDKPDQSAEATLRYIVDCGINAVELMGDPAESFAGKPKNPVDMRVFFPLMRAKREGKILTEAEAGKLADLEAQMASFRKEVAKWRTGASLDKFVQLRKMFLDAGVQIYGYKPDAFGSNNTDAEIDFGLRAAKTLGAGHVTLEHPGDDAHTLKLATMAKKYKIKVAYHGHEQQTPTFWDAALAQSKYNALNLDLGHYIAAGNTDALDLIGKHHKRLASMHTKDRQTPAHGKGNLPWGAGDTPIVPVLQLMRDRRYKFPATVELEYKVPEGSDAVKEVAKCVEFCRKALKK